MSNKPLWVIYKIRWDFIRKLCASVPADKELISRWLESRKPAVKLPSSKSIQEIQEEVFSTLPNEQPEESYGYLVFQRNQDGRLCLRAATIRAHMKDCSRQLSSLYIGKVKGERSFAVRVVNGVYPDDVEEFIHILRPDSTYVSASDGTFDKAVHAWTPQGMISGLKRIEYVRPASIQFRLKVLGGCISEEDLQTLFKYGGTHGYGGERGDGEGKYTFTIAKEETNEG